ncbi:MAG: hypothetical protein WD490_10545 [Opitutales bacterium]
MNSLSCPSCRKAVATPSDREQLLCGRCGCDLTELAALARAAEVKLKRAKRAIEASRPAEALYLATASWRLRRTPAAAKLACIAATASGHPRIAFDWIRRGEGDGRSSVSIFVPGAEAGRKEF